MSKSKTLVFGPASLSFCAARPLTFSANMPALKSHENFASLHNERTVYFALFQRK